MRKLQILILCAFVLSCKSTKTVTSQMNLSETPFHKFNGVPLKIIHSVP